MSFQSLAAMVLAGALVGAAFAAESSRFVQDEFAIGFWVDPPADAHMDARYREIAEAHFNLVLGGFGARTPETIDRQLALCAKYGLHALAFGRETPAQDLPEGDACWGYMLVDEPNARAFEELGRRVDAIREARPGKLAYINLFPDYASLGALGAPSYEAYVAGFMEQVRPDVLCMDYYPLFKPDRDGRDGYCGNLAVMREHALRADVPFWNFFNTMPYGPHTDPTEAQIRWQVYTTLTYGGKGILYFCYTTPQGGEFPKGGAVLTPEGRLTRHYGQAQRVNRAVRALGPTLMKLTSTGVYRVGPDDTPTDVLAETPIRDLTRDDHDPPHDYLVGAFDHEDGQRAVMLTNYRFAYTAWPTVHFDTPAAEVLEVDQTTGQARPVIDDSPAMDGLQIGLDAGEGRLFLLPPR